VCREQGSDNESQSSSEDDDNKDDDNKDNLLQRMRIPGKKFLRGSDHTPHALICSGHCGFEARVCYQILTRIFSEHLFVIFVSVLSLFRVFQQTWF